MPETTKAIAVLDRAKEPGASAEPLHLDTLTAVTEHLADPPLVIGGRYGLGSKEFFPRDAAAVFAELDAKPAKRRFTVGIDDDVTNLSLTSPPDFDVDSRADVSAVFFGLGSDGTVGANKATVKMIGEHTDLWVQGYFVYDSKKSGSTTVSHLRFGHSPIQSPYLIEQADFVSVQQFALLRRMPVLDVARQGASVLISCPYAADDTWDRLPESVQDQILTKKLKVYVVDAAAVAARVGLRRRINTVMQACFFALAKVIPVDEALELAKDSARKTYGRRGPEVVKANLDAIDQALSAMHPLVIPDEAWAAKQASLPNLCSPSLAEQNLPTPSLAAQSLPVTEDGVLGLVHKLMAGAGESVAVSEMPADGTFPTGTAKLEKRGLATELPRWEALSCIDCGKCSLACPHAAVRMKIFDPTSVEDAPDGYVSKPTNGRAFPAGTRLTVQIAPDDCTGCGICVTVCPARSKIDPTKNALDMVPANTISDEARTNFDYFLQLPEADRTSLRVDTVKGSQLLQPLFEFSGACSGCGETPYLKLVSQLFGDRMIVANATGCSSIFGGNLPTTPWTTDPQGRGPAWNNSLFEDNAEFGMGLGLGTAQRTESARGLLRDLSGTINLPTETVEHLLSDVALTDEAAIAAQRQRVVELKLAMDGLDAPGDAGAKIRRLRGLADALVPTAVWVVGGDGWAYDIGYGGLDHLFASGQDINVLVLDSEVYSNTGGQASKSTPRGASAKFAMAGKPRRKKDLGMMAQAYRDVYVAQISMAANETQAVRSILEAVAYPGPSLILAYATCTTHGVDLVNAAARQIDAVASGHWPLYRYQPGVGPDEKPVFRLDSKAPTLPMAEFYAQETRFSSIGQGDPELAASLLEQAQADADDRWARYEWLAGQ